MHKHQNYARGAKGVLCIESECITEAIVIDIFTPFQQQIKGCCSLASIGLHV